MASRPFHGFLALLLLLGALASGATPPAQAADDVGADAAIDGIRRHVVLVSFRFQRDIEGEEHDAVPPDPRGAAEGYRFWRLSRIVPGFVVRDPRTVLLSDPWTSPGAIASITVRTLDGFETSARLVGHLERVEGALLETADDLPVAPLTFGDGADGRPAFAGSVAEGPTGDEVWLEDLDRMRRERVAAPGVRGRGTPTSPFGGVGDEEPDSDRTVDLVTDGAGRPLGFRFGDTLPPDGRWRGAAVLSSPLVRQERLAELEAAAQEASPLHRVTVTFRTASRHDAERNPFSFRGGGTAEQEFWGLAITPDTLVVPGGLEDEEVRSILGVHLDASEEEEGRTLEYLGRLSGYEAFLVRLEEGGLAPLPAVRPAPPPAGSAVLSHRVAWRGGARRDQVEVDRVVGWGRGYGDRLFLVTERAVPSGTVLLDVSGDALGFAAVLDPEDQERRIGSGRRPGSRTQFPTVAVLFHETGLPATLVEKVDTRVMPQEETAARRLPWLGVEFDALDEGVAELLGVSAPTRDGQRGLVVTVVYPGSPAAKEGIAPGDVLLSARRLSGPGGPPIDLKESGSRDMFFPPGLFGMGDAAPAPWRLRSNGLVRLLQDWGEGTQYELTWWRKNAEGRATFRVELAPPDFASAPREFDEDAGLEVRDLTYEIRHVLRLAPEAVGVVVARVEPGSPAAQARIAANEILLELDGEAIADAKTFASMLEGAREAGRRQVRLAVRRLGRTRLVDLRVLNGRSGAGEDAGGGESVDEPEREE